MNLYTNHRDPEVCIYMMSHMFSTATVTHTKSLKSGKHLHEHALPPLLTYRFLEPQTCFPQPYTVTRVYIGIKTGEARGDSASRSREASQSFSRDFVILRPPSHRAEPSSREFPSLKPSLRLPFAFSSPFPVYARPCSRQRCMLCITRSYIL